MVPPRNKTKKTRQKGPPLHQRKKSLMGADPREQALKYASRVDFQAICYKLSASMLESRPEGASPPGNAPHMSLTNLPPSREAEPDLIPSIRNN